MSVREGVTVALGVAIWLAVVFCPVSWPLSDPGKSPFRLGPISADVRAGQTFHATEPFDQISLPVRIGGPFGESNELSLRVQSDGQDGSWSARSEMVRVKSTAEAVEQVTFDFEELLPATGLLYFEIEVSAAAEWPTYTLATLADQSPDGQLYLQEVPVFADQDLVFQLLRRQPLRERAAAWWSRSRGMVVSGAILLGLIHIAVFTIFRAAADTRAGWLGGVRPSVATLLTVAVWAGAIFLIAFFR